MGYLSGVPDNLGVDPEDLRRQAQEAAVAGKREEAVQLLLEAARIEKEAEMQLKLVDEEKNSSPPPCSSRANLLYP